MEPINAGDAERLLATDPALPSSWEVLAPSLGASPGEEAIDWKMTEESGDYRHCRSNGLGRVRVWNHRGEQWREPEVLQFVCAYPSDRDARRSYESTSIIVAAGENYPNLDGKTPVDELAPSSWDPKSVRGDLAQVVCATGSPDAICSDWIYRALYGRYIVEVFFRASGGGIGAESFLRLVRDIDGKITTSLAAGA